MLVIIKSMPQTARWSATIKAYAERFDFKAIVPISALNISVIEVLDEVKDFLTTPGWFFGADDTDQPERHCGG